MIKKLLITTYLTLFAILNLQAAPIDFDGDGYSDPSAVNPAATLYWRSLIDNETITIGNFGELGQHLVPGSYTSSTTQAATLDKDGNWRIDNHPTINFGESGSEYLAGADFDGDGSADLVYATNACSKKRSKFNISLNSFNTSVNKTLSAKRGFYFKTYLDSNNDNRDELCVAVPIKKAIKETKNFKLICKDVLSNLKTRTIRLGKVFNAPLPIKVENQTDLILNYKQSDSSTKLIVKDISGNKILKLKLNITGTVLIGNYTSTNYQDIVIVNQDGATAVDPLSGNISSINFPEGIPYDQINLVNFEDDLDCHCTTKRIKSAGSCNNNNLNIPDEDNTVGESTDYFIPDNCANPPNRISAYDGFKCMSSTTRGGSIVCLLPYQFTWAPYKPFTDHHGVTMSCNINDDHFDTVNLILDNGEIIPLAWDKCQNWVGTAEGKIGRQHFRNESYKWDDVKYKASRLEMTKNGQKTCLKF